MEVWENCYTLEQRISWKISFYCKFYSRNKISQKGQRTCITLIIKLEKEATQY